MRGTTVPMAAALVPAAAATRMLVEDTPGAEQEFTADKVALYMVIGVLALLVSYMTSAILIIRYTEGIWRLPLGASSCRSFWQTSSQLCRSACAVTAQVFFACIVPLRECCRLISCCSPWRTPYQGLGDGHNDLRKHYKRVHLDVDPHMSISYQSTSAPGVPTSEV